MELSVLEEEVKVKEERDEAEEVGEREEAEICLEMEYCGIGVEEACLEIGSLCWS